MFLKQFLSYFAGHPDNLHVDVESVEKIGRTFYFATEINVTELSSKIESLEKDVEIAGEEIEKLEADLFEEKSLNDKLEKELAELNKILLDYKISPTDTIKDLVDRNDWQEKKIAELQESFKRFNDGYNEDQKTIEKLRARKNKATVERCLTTGRLIASFGGVDYELITKN